MAAPCLAGISNCEGEAGGLLHPAAVDWAIQCSHVTADLLTAIHCVPQVMFSTGPMYLTVQYAMFPNRADVGVIPADVYGACPLG